MGVAARGGAAVEAVVAEAGVAAEARKAVEAVLKARWRELAEAASAEREAALVEMDWCVRVRVVGAVEVDSRGANEFA